MRALSPYQQQIMDLLRASGSGRLMRLKGGFWTTPECVAEQALGQYPLWSCDIRTVRALEKRGLLQRMNEFPEEWRDTRMLVPKTILRPSKQ